MRKFQFRLQTVLRHAEKDEQRLQLELAWLKIQKQEKQSQLEALMEARETTRKEFISRSKGAVDLDRIMVLRQHLESLDEQIAVKQEELALAATRVEEKTSEVIEAMKKRRILEKLREREKDAHTLALNRLEIKMLDDTTMPRYTMETRV